MNIMKALKSVNISATISNERMNPEVNSILNWLEGYNLHWLKSLGITEGHNAHLLYDRLVIFEAPGIPACPSELSTLAKGVRNLGMLFVWRLEIDDLMSFPIPIQTFIEESGVSTVAVTFDKKLDTRAYECLKALLSSNCNVQLIGNLGFLMESGLLSEPCYNQRHAEIVNVDTARPELIKVATKTKNCSGRLSLSISPSGYIFPCPYLLRTSTENSIWDIERPFHQLVADDAEAMQALKGLIELGPGQLPNYFEGEAEKGLPVECQLHLKLIREAVDA
jgi:hypothetical protein